jgi:hypothetical protein
MDNNNIGNPISSWFYRSGDNLLPLTSTLEIGSSATRIAKGWFTNLDASSVVIGAIASGVLKLPNGTAAAPSITFTSDATKGIYSSGSGELGFSIGGLQIGYIASSGLYFPLLISNETTTLSLYGRPADGASAVGVAINANTALSTSGAKIASFQNATTEKAYVDKDGAFVAGNGVGTGLSTGAAASGFRLGNMSSAYGYFNFISNTFQFVAGAGGSRDILFKPIISATETSKAAFTVDNQTTLTATGAKLQSWKNNTTEKAFIDKDGAFGSVLGAATLDPGATTFAAQGNVMTVTGDGGGNTVATITNGVVGQRLTLIFVDALVTITDTDAHTANTVDLSAAFTSADDTTLTLVFDGTSWYEVSRSVN